jgi:two-component system, chemotaxis family, protein-glutamate methylesterase/glutaminase
VSGTRRNEAPSFDLVIVAASYGGIGATIRVLAVLPPWFPAAVLVVQHRRPDRDQLAPILSRRGPLPVDEALQGGVLTAGRVTVCPPGGQLGIGAGGVLTLDATAERCGADDLLVSGALAYGSRVIAAVLTGRQRDGAVGVAAVKAHGGRVIAQDRATSAAFEMPSAAIATGCVDYVLPLGAIASAISTLVCVPGAADLFSVRSGPWAAAAG